MSSTPDGAALMARLRRRGVLLQSARGPVPNVAELVAGEPIRGSWWAHPQGHAIFAAINRLRSSPAVVATRLIDGKVTLIHRRLWPAFVRLVDRFPPPALARGMFTGNRGCLADDAGNVVRHHGGQLWITCLTEYRAWRHPLAAPGRWTPIFFLDEAVALAAGHRPCALCRRDAYRSYRDAVTASVGSPQLLLASALNRRLVAERHRRGRGLARAGDRLVWEADIDSLPAGAVVRDGDAGTRLLLDDRMLAFTFDGWTTPIDRPGVGVVHMMTPPTSVAALAHGYT